MIKYNYKNKYQLNSKNYNNRLRKTINQINYLFKNNKN